MKKTSLKQIIANQLNALKSTGPKTEEGKNRSRMNGQRHGLTGHGFLMLDEDRVVHEAFVERFIADLKPVGPVEENYAYLVAKAHFRLNRAHAIEENTFALGHYNRAAAFEADHEEVHACGTQARVFDMKGDVFKNLTLYEQRLSREMHKNHKALKDLQAERKAEEQLAAREVPETKAASASNGFAFSTEVTPTVEAVGSFSPTSETPPQEDKKAA